MTAKEYNYYEVKNIGYRSLRNLQPGNLQFYDL
jgi:hypothetical protein